jgi:hypothetical protein
MLQRRHCEYLADWLANAVVAVSDRDRCLLADNLCDWLERDNPRFDRIGFLMSANCWPFESASAARTGEPKR